MAPRTTTATAQRLAARIYDPQDFDVVSEAYRQCQDGDRAARPPRRRAVIECDCSDVSARGRSASREPGGPMDTSGIVSCVCLCSHPISDSDHARDDQPAQDPCPRDCRCLAATAASDAPGRRRGPARGSSGRAPSRRRRHGQSGESCRRGLRLPFSIIATSWLKAPNASHDVVEKPRKFYRELRRKRDRPDFVLLIARVLIELLCRLALNDGWRMA